MSKTTIVFMPAQARPRRCPFLHGDPRPPVTHLAKWPPGTLGDARGRPVGRIRAWACREHAAKICDFQRTLGYEVRAYRFRPDPAH